MVMIAVESHVFTGAVVRRLKNLKQVTNVYELTGDYDIVAYVKVPDTLNLNNLIEELRIMPGVKKNRYSGSLEKNMPKPTKAFHSIRELEDSMGTLVEEIFSRRLNRPVRAGEIILMDVDFIMSHDNTTPLAIKAFNEIGKIYPQPRKK